jgi:thiosulfate/3-mercaptopyruvate sulfurtransferase
MRKLNIRKSDIVVVYDKVGMLSSPRAFWLLKLFGMPNVHLLNGTFSKWEAEKRPVIEGDTPCAWSRVNRKT